MECKVCGGEMKKLKNFMTGDIEIPGRWGCDQCGHQIAFRQKAFGVIPEGIEETGGGQIDEEKD